MKSNPLKWHGGKRYLAQWIIAYFPRHTHYVEPYFGGGAVLFAKPDRLVIDHSEVVNDINGQLVNFWRCVRNEYKMKELIVELGLTPVSSHVFQEALKWCEGLDRESEASSMPNSYSFDTASLDRA